MGFVNFSAIRYCYLLAKYAATEKVLAALDRIKPSDEVREYVLSLPDELMPFAIGFLAKNPSADNTQLHAHLKEVSSKKKKVEQTREELLKQLPESLQHDPPKYREWAVRQIKKHPSKKDLILSKIEDIVDFADDYGLEIESYEAEQILNEMAKELNQDESDANSMETFFSQIKKQEKRTLNTTRNTRYNLVVWAANKFLGYRKEWEKKILKYMHDTGKSFRDLLEEGAAIYQAQRNGELLGVDLEASPLHHAEHAKLLNNFPFIADWYAAMEDANGPHEVFDVLKTSSLADVLEETREFHDRQAAKGEGREYEPINPRLIVYGPNNWKDPANQGHFIIEVKSANDLAVEGFKMDHCVGGYCDLVEQGDSRIFSLRNSANQPLVTIETDPQAFILRQVYGPGNSDPSQQYHDMVQEWIDSQDRKINLDAVSPEDLSDLAYNSKNPTILSYLVDKGYTELLLERDDIPASLLEYVARVGDHYDKLRVVKHANVTPEILASLAGFFKLTDWDEDVGEEVRFWIAKNQKTPVEALISLTQDSASTVRNAAAENPKTPSEELDKLANQTENEIWRAVATNPSASENTLRKIYKFFGESGDRPLAMNTSTPADILEDIYSRTITTEDDGTQTVSRRYNLAETLATNTSAPVKVLEQLLVDNTPGERWYPSVVSTGMHRVRVRLAGNPSISEVMMASLCVDRSLSVREALLENPSLTTEVVQYMATNDPSPKLEHMAREILKNRGVEEA